MWKRTVLDEVTDQASILKKDYSQPHLHGTDDDLGLENATFKWNEVAEHVDKDSDKGKSKVDLLLLQIQVRRTKLAVGDSVSERSAEIFEKGFLN